MMTTETDLIPSSPTSTSDLSAVAAHVTKMTSSDRMSYRKTTKPMMEKKRRARINHCLTQLKSLVLQAMKKDNSQYSKLEKADILELTVKHLKNVQRIQASTNSSSSQIPAEAFSKYRAGFNECANEVVRYLGETQGLNNDARTRILSHLSNILSPVNSLPLQQTSSAQILSTPGHILPGHAPILPAPTPANQLHQQQQLHNLNIQLQHSNINNTLTLLQHHQQQQELSQNVNSSLKSSLYKELQQRQNQPHQQQSGSVISSGSFLGGHHSHSILSVPDLNNNSVIHTNNNNNDNVINRNIVNTSIVHSHNDNNSHCTQIPTTTNNNQTSRSNTISQQNINFVDSNPSRDFKSPNAISGSAPPSSFHLPCIATPGSMTTTATPFQLVHSTLPNGQIALVLAPTITPQTLPAVNVHQTLPPSLMSTDMPAMSIAENQNQTAVFTLKQERCPSNLPPQHGQLQQLSRPLSPDSQGQNHFACQEKPISLVNKSPKRLIEHSSLNTIKPNLNAEHSKIHHEHSSGFRQPASSSNLSNPSTTSYPIISSSPSPSSSSSSSSSSIVSSSVIKSSYNTSYNTNVCLQNDQKQQKWQHKPSQSSQQSGSRLSASPPRITELSIGDSDSRSGTGSPAHALGSTTQSVSREVVRSPEDVMCKRDLFEYKMAKSRSRSRSQEESVSKGTFGNDGSNAWRPW